MSSTGLDVWLLMLAVLLLISAKDIADTLRNLKDGGGNPPDHPLPATGSIEKSRKRAKDSNDPLLPI
jgi:hypothetical protein